MNRDLGGVGVESDLGEGEIGAENDVPGEMFSRGADPVVFLTRLHRGHTVREHQRLHVVASRRLSGLTDSAVVIEDVEKALAVGNNEANCFT